MLSKEADLNSQKFSRPLHLFSDVNEVQIEITIGTRKTTIRVLYKNQFAQPYHTLGEKKLLGIVKDSSLF